MDGYNLGNGLTTLALWDPAPGNYDLVTPKPQNDRNPPYIHKCNASGCGRSHSAASRMNLTTYICRSDETSQCQANLNLICNISAYCSR